mmetsp:Transcript_23003/g.31958  ORF Transcript_23003/g.31958 Transcript_23003/m.31958 type:complete len:488 (+) Transcript_23003:59-1522(+)
MHTGYIASTIRTSQFCFSINPKINYVNFVGIVQRSLSSTVGPEEESFGQSLRIISDVKETWNAPKSKLIVPPKTERVAVLRNAFTPAGEIPLTLSKLIKKTDESTVVIDPSVLSTRPLVDSYIRVGSVYHLEENSVCLLKYLKSSGLRALLPNSAATLLKSQARAEPLPTSVLRQSTNQVLMVAPTGFQSNLQAAEDNHFMADAAGGQGKVVPPEGALRRKVLEEYMGLYKVLVDQAGLQVNLMSHDDSHGTPDACFPNNWFSTHYSQQGGYLALYPMKVPNRQLERRQDIMDFIVAKDRYTVTEDFTREEQSGVPRYLEGTGSLVIDRIGRVAYVALSDRTDEALAREWAKKLDYELVTYHCVDRSGLPVYHTNVVQAIGTSFAVIVEESVRDPKERARLMESLAATREVISITYDQMERFCGNVLEVEDSRGLPCLALSTQAYDAFTPDQRSILRNHVAELYHAPIDTLEAVGGGGVRCCIAEIF